MYPASVSVSTRAHKVRHLEQKIACYCHTGMNDRIKKPKATLATTGQHQWNRCLHPHRFPGQRNHTSPEMQSQNAEDLQLLICYSHTLEITKGRRAANGSLDLQVLLGRRRALQVVWQRSPGIQVRLLDKVRFLTRSHSMLQLLITELFQSNSASHLQSSQHVKYRPATTHESNSPTPTPSLTSTVQCCSQQLRQNWCWQARESKFSFRTNCMHTAQWWEECTIACERQKSITGKASQLPWRVLNLTHCHFHHLHWDNGLRGALSQNRLLSEWRAGVLHCTAPFSWTSSASWSTTDEQSLNSFCLLSSATQNSPLFFWFLLFPCLKSEKINLCVCPFLHLLIFFVSWVRLNHCSTRHEEQLELEAGLAMLSYRTMILGTVFDMQMKVWHVETLYKEKRLFTDHHKVQGFSHISYFLPTLHLAK